MKKHLIFWTAMTLIAVACVWADAIGTARVTVTSTTVTRQFLTNGTIAELQSFLAIASTNLYNTNQFTNSGSITMKPGALLTNLTMTGGSITNGTNVGGIVMGVTNSNLTASRAMVLDANKIPTNSVTTAAEIAFLSGKLSVVQYTDFNANQFTAGAGNVVVKSNALFTNLVSVGNGVDSTLIGSGSTADGDQSVSVGNSTTADGSGATSVGYVTTASGDFSVAFGWSSEATAASTIAIGNAASATANGGIAIGQVASAVSGATAVGASAAASGTSATSLGQFTTSSGTSGLAVGALSGNTATRGLAIGNSATNSATQGIAIGYRAHNSGTNGAAIGHQATNTVDNRFVFGTTTNLVYVPGIFNAASITNSTMTGSNIVSGLVIYTPSTIQTNSAGSTVLANATKIRVYGNGGAVTLTSTPTIADGADGQMLYITCTDGTNTITFQDEGGLAGSNLQLGAATRLVGLNDFLVLQFDATAGAWCEISFANN